MTVVLTQEQYENIKAILAVFANLDRVNKSGKPNTLSVGEIRELGGQGLDALEEGRVTANTFTCRRFKSVGTFEFTADFNEPSSPIMVSFRDDDVWHPVPFQVADCRDRTDAERKIADYFR